MDSRMVVRRLTSLFVSLALATLGTAAEPVMPDPAWDPYLQPSAFTLFATQGRAALASQEAGGHQAHAIREKVIVAYQRGEFEESLTELKAYRQRLSEMRAQQEAGVEDIQATLLLCQLELLLGQHDQALKDLPDETQWDKVTLRHQQAIAGSLRSEALFQQGYHLRGLTALGEVRERLVEGIVLDETADIDPGTLLFEKQVSLRLANMAATYGQLQYAAACEVRASRELARMGSEAPDALSETARAIVNCTLHELAGRIEYWSSGSDASMVRLRKAIDLREEQGLRNDRKLVQLILEASRVQMDMDAQSDPHYGESLRLLARAEELLGTLHLDHPIESARLSSLRAEVALRQGNYEEAEERIKQSNSLLGDANSNHPVAILNNLNQLAIPSEMSRQNRARLMAIEVTKLAENCVAEAGHYSLECGRIFEAAGEARAAEEMYAYTIKLLGPTCGPASPTVAITVDELSDLYLAGGDDARAAGFIEVYLAKLAAASDVLHKPAYIAEVRGHFEEKLKRVRSVPLDPSSP